MLNKEYNFCAALADFGKYATVKNKNPTYFWRKKDEKENFKHATRLCNGG